MPRLPFRLLALAFGGAVLAAPARADDHVTIGTDWRAEASHGGIYEAAAAGIYRRHHLDVTIVQGGPNLNQAQLLAAGRLDFSVQSDCFEPLNFVKQGVPIVAVAAGFQKDPQVLIAHRGEGNDTLEEMRGKPIMISAEARDNWWQFLRLRYGFGDGQIRPYNYSLVPFLVNPKAIVQGYLSDEPYAIELQAHEKPVTILLADHGYASYAELIATTRAMIAAHPDVVRRFVAATMEGWKEYLQGDPAPGNAMILHDNPEMNPDLLNHARAAIVAAHLVDSGDAQKDGIGVMTDARWKQFFDFAVEAGLYPADLDYRAAYTTQFVGGK